MSDIALTRNRMENLKEIQDFFRAKPLGAIGAVIILLLVLLALFAPWVAPYSPITTDMGLRFQAPSAAHLMGTDELGRDILSRIIYGIRITLIAAFLSVALGMTIGMVLGMIAAYYTWLDQVVQRFMDMLLAFPSIILALVILAVLGQGPFNLIVALAISFIPRANRIGRSAVLSIRQSAYVEAARVTGCSSFRIVFHHIMPNCVAPSIIYAASLLSTAVLVESSLSFLGLGIPPPTPSWGRSLFEAVPFMRIAPWASIFPGLAISIVVFAVNLLADALRDTLDPRLRTH